MARSQPYTVACSGGLITSANSIDLLKTPGVARELRNFEVSIEGGYRRINGFTKLGVGDAVRPTGGAATILGVQPYADGVVTTAGTNVYFSQDGQDNFRYQGCHQAHHQPKKKFVRWIVPR